MILEIFKYWFGLVMFLIRKTWVVNFIRWELVEDQCVFSSSEIKLHP